MTLNPKLEFWRFSLNHRSNEPKTFRDFAIDTLKTPKNSTDEQVLGACFKHFQAFLASEIATDAAAQKKLGFEKRKTLNIHFDKGPQADSDNQVISGVINGGPFGRDGFMSNNDDAEDNARIKNSSVVNMHFFIFLYLPADHEQGFFMIHSNSREETISHHFKNFVLKVFTKGPYRKPIPEDFCPASFQEDFRKDATISKLVFRREIIDDIHTTQGSQTQYGAWKVRIEIEPIYEMRATEAENTMSKVKRKLFGSRGSEMSLDDFNKQLVLENDVTHDSKTFDWDKRDLEFKPVVHLRNRVETYSDGTPNFTKLKEYCYQLFKDEILHEIRPDLSVK